MVLRLFPFYSLFVLRWISTHCIFPEELSLCVSICCKHLFSVSHVQSGTAATDDKVPEEVSVEEKAGPGPDTLRRSRLIKPNKSVFSHVQFAA
jgi:hypothetical protein